MAVAEFERDEPVECTSEESGAVGRLVSVQVVAPQAHLEHRQDTIDRGLQLGVAADGGPLGRSITAGVRAPKSRQACATARTASSRVRPMLASAMAVASSWRALRPELPHDVVATVDVAVERRLGDTRLRWAISLSVTASTPSASAISPAIRTTGGGDRGARTGPSADQLLVLGVPSRFGEHDGASFDPEISTDSSVPGSAAEASTYAKARLRSTVNP